MDEKTLLSRLRSEEDYERELLSRLQYVEDIPTVGGFAREAGKAVALGGASAVASSLRGSSAASAAIEKIRDTRLREQVQFQLDRATSAVRPEDPTMAAREIRRLANLYMEKDERDELTALANEIEKGPEEREEAKKAIEETKPFTGPYQPLSERLPYKAGEALEKRAESSLERRKGYEEGKIGFGLDVAQGAGSITGIVGASMLGGYPGVIASSAFMGIDEQFQRAKKAGLKEEEAVDYALAGAGPGAIGTLSAEFMLRKIPVPIRSKMLRIAGEVAGAGAGEAMVEAAQQMMQNALEMRYNKDVGLFDGTIYAGAVGGAAGLALKPIFMALVRGKGASVSGPQEPDVEAHDAERIRREFAMEEVRLRAEEVRAKGAAGSDSGEVGEAPGTPEAVVREAARGKIKEAGERVTVRVGNGADFFHGTRKSDQPNELGQYEFFDRDGTKLVYEADEFDVKKGWLNEKTDAELEQDLERWLKAESPWQKVTVTTPDGEVIKGVASGELDGKHFVRGPDGELLPQGTGEISPGWDASTTTKPPTFTGERAKTKAAVTPLTESDKGSPIPNALIQEGKGVLADAQGVEAANKVLEALGLPAVDTEVGYRKPDGSVVRATIQDAAGDKFSILTEEGELKVGSAETLTRRIVPLPEEGETDVQEAGAQGEQVRQQDQGLQEGRRDGSGRPQADQDSQGRTQPSLEGQVVSPAAREPVAETAATPQAPEPQAVTSPLAGEVESAPSASAAPPPADVPEQRRQEDQPPPLEQEPVTREWWDSATPEQRRTAVVTAGFSEQITPTRARPSRQGDSYVSSEWDSLPAAARTSIATASRPAIRTYAQSRAQQALSDTSVSLSATPARAPVARIATRDIPDGGATARTASGAKVPVRYAVVEASSLAASLLPDGRLNPNYPAELQPRDRSSAPSKDQIEYIANNLDPEQLERSPKTSDGAPIISPDGVVESGNGRVTALRRAYERGAAEDYRNFLRYKGYPVADMKEPVLVRVRENEFTPDERISFVKDANEPDVLAMSATEPKPETKAEAEVAKEPTRSAEPSDAKPSTRGKQLKKPAAKAGGRGKADETGAKQVAKPTKKLAKTQPKPAAPVPTPKQEGLIYRKNGQPFASEQSAMMTHSQETHEAVQVDGGWAVRRKDSGIKAQRPQEARTTKTSAQEKATQQIRDYLDQVGLRDVLGIAQPQVRLPDGTWVAGAYLSKEQAARIDGIRQAIVKVSLEDSPDYAATVRHEVIHALRDMNLFYDGEWSALESAAKADKALMASIEERYPNLSKEAQVEEAVADMFAAHVSGANKQKGFIGRLLDKIRDFFKGLGDAFRSADLKTAKQVFAAIERGEVGNRPRVPTKTQVLRSEAFAKKALAELGDPGGGIIKASIIAKWRGSDFDFAKDVGTTRKVVASPRQNASLSPHSAPWYVTQKNQQAMRDTIAAQLGREYEPYQKLKATNRLNVDKVLELGMMEDSVYRPSQAGTITVTAGTDTGLMRAGESLTLTQEETEAYQSVRKMLGKALDLYRASVVMRFGFDPNTVRTARDAMGLITPTTSKADEAKIKLLAKMLTDLKQSERTGYTPLSRFGNVVVLAKGRDPQTGREVVLHSETIEVTGFTGWLKKNIIGAPEIDRLKAQLEAKYPGATVTAFQVAAKNDPRPMHERDVLVELLNVPPQDLEAKLKELEKSSLERGFRRHFFRAKKIPGYSLDFERSIADYVMNLSGNVARSAYHKQWKDAINAIPKNKPYEIQYAEKYHEYTNNPQEEFSALRQIGFVSFLASNISNAFFNGLQVPFVSIPYMSMFSPVAKVGVEVARASKDVGLMFSKRRGFDFFDPDKAPLDVRADLKRAWDAGEFVSLGVFDMVGVANTGSRLKRQLGFKTRKIVEYMAIPQTLIERTNRVSTYIAAHRMARKGGAAFEAKVRQILEKNALAQETVLKDYSPDAFARFMVDETHFDMGKINRPQFMRSYGAPLFQFQSYTVNYIETLYKTASMYGAPGKKAFGMMVAGLLMSSGMFAFPFADDAMFLAELLHKWWTGLDKDIRSDIREAVYELTGSPALGAAVTNGVFHTIGIDATNRVGLGKILPRSPEEAGGVPLSLLTGAVWGTATSIKEGRWGEALIGPLPLALKNAATAAMWNYKGVRTQYGDVVIPPDQVTPGQVALKAFGFTPSSVSDQRAMEWSQQRASKATQDLRTKYYSRMAKTIAALNKASEEGDAKGAIKYERELDEIIDDLAKHNEWAAEEEKYHLIVKLDRKTLKKRVAAEYVGRGVIRDKEAPKLSRPRRQELREIYGVDAE